MKYCITNQNCQKLKVGLHEFNFLKPYILIKQHYSYLIFLSSLSIYSNWKIYNTPHRVSNFNTDILNTNPIVLPAFLEESMTYSKLLFHL